MLEIYPRRLSLRILANQPKVSSGIFLKVRQMKFKPFNVSRFLLTNMIISFGVMVIGLYLRSDQVLDTGFYAIMANGCLFTIWLLWSKE